MTIHIICIFKTQIWWPIIIIYIHVHVLYSWIYTLTCCITTVSSSERHLLNGADMILRERKAGIVIAIPGHPQNQLGCIEPQRPVLEYPRSRGIVARVGAGHTWAVDLTPLVVWHDDQVVCDQCQLSVLVAPPIYAVGAPGNVKRYLESCSMCVCVCACEMEGGWVRNVHMYDINI